MALTSGVAVGWRRAGWVLLPLAWTLLSFATLSWLVEASFGPTPAIGDAHHLFFGQAYLLTHGLSGTALAAWVSFRLLRTVRKSLAAVCIAASCAPCLIFSLCQLWAWAMFVGWA
jgi:hypothetical protein